MAARLIIGDRVVTAGGPQGDAIVVEDGLVAAVGEAKAFRGSGLPEQRHEGVTIIGGLRDAHFHPLVYAAALTRPSLKTAADLAEVLDILREAAAGIDEGHALIASRLDDEVLAERRLPTRQDLDRAVPDRPVLLHRYCGHIAVANTAALRAADVTASTADPPGGAFDRDETNEPNGVLRETAVAAVGAALGTTTSGPTAAQLVEAMRGLTRLGLTSIGAIVSSDPDPWCGVPGELELLVEAAPDLPLDVAVLVVASRPGQLRAAAEMLSSAGPRLRFLGLKGFADGSLGGHTAALASPYRDAPGTTGTSRLDPDTMLPLARESLELGGQVALHAIGDVANANVLSLFEQLITEGASHRDLRVEHASVLPAQELHRMAALGVTASVQPAFLPSETSWLRKRLGQQRLRVTYPFATMLQAGIPLAGGSDCPVERPDPLWGMAAARDRGGLTPEEALDPRQALGLFTDGAAVSLRERPPLAVGTPATFVGIDRDPLTGGPDDLRAADVVIAFRDGERVEVPDRPPHWPG